MGLCQQNPLGMVGDGFVATANPQRGICAAILRGMDGFSLLGSCWKDRIKPSERKDVESVENSIAEHKDTTGNSQQGEKFKPGTCTG